MATTRSADCVRATTDRRINCATNSATHERINTEYFCSVAVEAEATAASTIVGVDVVWRWSATRHFMCQLENYEYRKRGHKIRDKAENVGDADVDGAMDSRSSSTKQLRVLRADAQRYMQITAEGTLNKLRDQSAC